MMHWDPRRNPWHIDESEFYELDDVKAQKEFLLRYAVLAPSGHNTQPWSFRLTDDGFEVYPDYSRRLPVADPLDRELLLSIGAAITNLRVAAAHFGFETTVLYESRLDDSLPAAVVTLRETCNPDAKLCALFCAIEKRHTNRTDFEVREIEPAALDAICDLVDEHGDSMRFVVPHERARTAELVAEADRILMSDDAWRAELAEWIRPNESSAGDGISADAFGIHGPLSALGPWIVRSFDVSEAKSKKDQDAIDHAAGLIVITSDDDRTALIRAGERLEILLLQVTQLGVQYGFVNQPIEVPALRRELWSLIRSPKAPQVLVRIGYARPVKRAMPRRETAAVLV